MAYTGILLRGDTFNTIYLDPPIDRELVVAGEHLGLTTVGSTTYWLNVAALSTISMITDDQGTSIPGINTSALPIDFDGDGYLKEEVDHLLVGGTYLFRYAALNALEALTDSSFKFGSYDLVPANLDFLNGAKPTMSVLTIDDVVVTFTQGVKALVYNETTREELGIVDTSEATLTFGSAQTVGDVITAVCLDADYNHSMKDKLTIA